MTYIYYNNSGLVKMISEKKVKTSLKSLKHNFTSDETDKLDKKYIITIRDKKLNFEKPIHIKKTETETLKAELKAKAEDGSITLEDITVFIKNFL